MICTISKHAAERKGYADAMMLDAEVVPYVKETAVEAIRGHIDAARREDRA